MDIKELHSFKLSDAVKFHDRLNPKLWIGEHLDPQVRKQLLVIAKDFMTELGIHTPAVDDITISGSNAAYSYTPHSDLDLHILVDMSKLLDNDVYKELFHAKKTLYNDSHDITIRGVPVELYIQDSNEPVVSLGEYSILNDRWIKRPTKRRANLDQNATRAKFDKLLEMVSLALKTKDLKKLTKVIKNIKRYRQAGLDKGGEFSPENLAYKALRSQGLIEKLYKLRDKLHSELLSIDEMYRDPVTIQKEEQEKTFKASQVWNYVKKIHPADQQTDAGAGFWDKHRPNQNIWEAFDQPYPIKWEKGEFADYDALATLPDGKPLHIMFNNEGDGEFFIEFYRNNSQEVTGEGDAQRVFSTVLNAIQEFIKKEHPWRLMFSASKDNWAKQQKNSESRAKLYDRLVQRYANAWGYDMYHEDHGDQVTYELTQLKQNVKEASGYIPSAKQKNDPRFKTALTVDVAEEKEPLIMYHVTPTRNLPFIKRRGLIPTMGSRSSQIEHEVHGVFLFPDKISAEDAVMNWLGDQFDEDEDLAMLAVNVSGLEDSIQAGAEYEKISTVPIEPSRIKVIHTMLECSGYIPSVKQKNDPRFEKALTVDVHPDTMKKGAKKFGWKISRAGIPPTANPNGKF